MADSDDQKGNEIENSSLYYQLKSKQSEQTLDLSNDIENVKSIMDEKYSSDSSSTKPFFQKQYCKSKETSRQGGMGSQSYLTSSMRQSMIKQCGDDLSLPSHYATSQLRSDETPSRESIDYAPQAFTAQAQPPSGTDYPGNYDNISTPCGQLSSPKPMTSQIYGLDNQRKYATRDATHQDSALCTQGRIPRNLTSYAGSGGYVTIQNSSQLSQSASLQSSSHPSINRSSQELSAVRSYNQCTLRPQSSYGAVPNSAANRMLHDPHNKFYADTQFRSPVLTSPQRFPQDMMHYQGQPIIQPVSQSVINRGPKPMVPPRAGSKITHEVDHHKPISVDVRVPKLENMMVKCDLDHRDDTGVKDETVVSSGAVANLGTMPEKTFATPLNQTPRTRQDGLYVDTSTNQISKNQSISPVTSDYGLYASCTDNHKSMPTGIKLGFPKHDDSITFTFLEDNPHFSNKRDKSMRSGDEAWADENQLIRHGDRRNDQNVRTNPSESITQQHDIDQQSTMHEQKIDWKSLGLDQQITRPQEYRRSDHPEERRSSPMPVEAKYTDEGFSSYSPFISVQESANDCFLSNKLACSNQSLEKAKHNLANWIEHRQRPDVAQQIYQDHIIVSSCKPKNETVYYHDTLASHSDENHRLKDHRNSQTGFQPIPHISPNTIIEQRRHLRHVSADLSKQIEFRRKEYEGQPTTGSVTNLITVINSSSSQHSSPNLCQQFSRPNEILPDSNEALTVTDFGGDSKNLMQRDHSIHDGKMTYDNVSNHFLTHSRSNMENLQMLPSKLQNDNKDSNQGQRKQQYQNQRSLNIISEKLTQFERQQNDLQARLQCLQNQNQLLDQVAQFQHQQNDFHTCLRTLQERKATEKTLKDNVDSQHNVYSSSVNLRPYTCQSIPTNNEIPSRLFDEKGCKLNSPIPSSDTLKFQQPEEQRLTKSHSVPHQKSVMMTSLTKSSNISMIPSSGAMNLTSNTISSTTITVSPLPGILKKVPPEKPPRTSRITQKPDIENAAQTISPNGKGAALSTSANTSGGNGTVINGSNLDDDSHENTVHPEHALVYRDGNLVSGSLEALVQHMVPTEEYYPERSFLFAFLLSARLFIKPHELLSEVCALCQEQQNLNGDGGKERLQRFVPRLVQLLAEWTETFPYDFRDERVMAHVRSITQKVASVDATARQEVSALLQNLLLRLTALERYEEGLGRLATEAAAQQLSQVDVTELCPSAMVLAQQLTHVELEKLSYIGPEEFVQAFAKESLHLETSFKEMKKTRNLESYVQWFNRLSYVVATEICKHVKKKQRVRVVEYWIETARECFNIGNFNSLMAIIAGLNMSPISRLKKTWSKIHSAKFAILEHQMDPSSNFSSYRSTLKAAMWRSVGATDERQRIVVPFFSLLVKDLYFLNEGCSNRLANGHINFEKFWQLAKQVTEFMAWKQVTCPFEKNPRVLAFLQASPVLTENALALASFECEAPDGNPEKERFKTLKSELNA